MRVFKKLLLWFAAVSGALVIALALAAVLLIARPQWFLSDRTAAWAARTFGRAYHPRWETLAFGIRSLSFREKQLSLRAQGLCFENADAGLEGCLKDLDLQLNVRLYFWGAKLTRISRFIVTGDHFTLDQTRARPAAPPKKSAGLPASLPGLLPAALRGIMIESLKVDLPANKLVRAGGSLRGALRLSLDQAKALPLTLKAELEQSSGTVTRHYRGEATLDSDILNGRALTYLDARGRLNAEGVDAKFQARADQKGTDPLTFSLSASALLPGRRLEAGLKGSQTGQDISLNGSAGVWLSSGPVKRVQFKHYTLAARLKKDSTEWESLKFDGRFLLEPEAFGIKVAGRGLDKMLEGRLTAGARSTPGLLAGDHFDAEVSLTVKPVKDWYEFYGSFDAAVSGRTSQVEELKISHKLDFGLKVPHFEDLILFLARTPYSVPAPINVLRGPLSFSLKGSGDTRKNLQDFEYALISGLAAGRQALKFEIKGKVAATGLWAPGRSFKNETAVILNDIALQLPKVDLKGMATFIPDSRIRTGRQSDEEALAREEERNAPVTASAPTLRGEISVRTAKPVLLYSNLAKDPVPIGLEINLKIPAAGMLGTIEVRPFRAKIFRRIAAIDHIRLSGRAGSPIMDLDGLIVYKAAEAQIFIRLHGTAQKPKVNFESEPPMSQGDIMAMLLFGKSPGKLDSDQQSSAANVQTAVSNSAFGLASLYLLASTPVEYVGYDPVSRAYTVKLRLPGGTMLQLGSDGDKKGVQLRRRIASHLAIQTELTNTQTQGNIVTTLLEWYGRN